MEGSCKGELGGLSDVLMRTWKSELGVSSSEPKSK